MKQHKFEVGDNVRRMRGHLYDGYWPSGDRVITVTDTTDTTISVDGDDYRWMAEKFTLVTAANDSIDNQIKRAKSLIGRKCQWVGLNGKGDKHRGSIIPKSVEVLLKGVTSSDLVEKYLKDNEYCVTLMSGNTSIPLAYIPVKPTEISIKLSDDYTAIVENDVVKVGCQTIKRETVEEILEAFKTLNA